MKDISVTAYSFSEHICDVTCVLKVIFTLPSKEEEVVLNAQTLMEASQLQPPALKLVYEQIFSTSQLNKELQDTLCST